MGVCHVSAPQYDPSIPQSHHSEVTIPSLDFIYEIFCLSSDFHNSVLLEHLLSPLLPRCSGIRYLYLSKTGNSCRILHSSWVCTVRVEYLPREQEKEDGNHALCATQGAGDTATTKV